MDLVLPTSLPLLGCMDGWDGWDLHLQAGGGGGQADVSDDT